MPTNELHFHVCPSHTAHRATPPALVRLRVGHPHPTVTQPPLPPTSPPPLRHSLERVKFDQLLGPLRQTLDSAAEKRISLNALAPARKGAAAPIEWRPFDLIVSNPEVIPDQHTLDLAAVFGQVAVLTIPQGM